MQGRRPLDGGDSDDDAGLVAGQSKWIAYTKHARTRCAPSSSTRWTTGKAAQVTDGMSDARYPGVRQRRQVPLLHRQHRRRRRLEFGLDMPRIDAGDAQRLPGRAVEGRAVAARARERRREGRRGEEAGRGRSRREGRRTRSRPGRASRQGRARRRKKPVDGQDRLRQHPPAHPGAARARRATTPACRPARPACCSCRVAARARRCPPAAATALTVHRYDLKARKTDKVVERRHRVRGLAPTARRCSTGRASKWFIAALEPGAGPAATARRRRRAQDRRHRGPRGPARRVAADVPRGVAHRARLLLRPELPRPRPAGRRRRSTRPTSTGIAHRADLNYLFREMLGEMTVGHMYVSGGDMPEVKRVPGGPARRRLRGRERAVPLRARLQRRELEPAAARAADAARRERRGGRVPPRGQRPRAARRRQRLLVLRGTAGKTVGARVGRNAGGDGRPRGDGGAGRQRERTAQPGLDRGQPAQGGRSPAASWPTSTCPTPPAAATRTSTATSSRRSDKEGVIIDERFNGGGAAGRLHHRLPEADRCVSCVAPREGEDTFQPLGRHLRARR